MVGRSLRYGQLVSWLYIALEWRIIMYRRFRFALVALLPLALALTVASSGAAAALATRTARTSHVTSSSLGTYSPTFAGPAATGCASGCSLLTGPFRTPSTASLSSSDTASTAP